MSQGMPPEWACVGLFILRALEEIRPPEGTDVHLGPGRDGPGLALIITFPDDSELVMPLPVTEVMPEEEVAAIWSSALRYGDEQAERWGAPLDLGYQLWLRRAPVLALQVSARLAKLARSARAPLVPGGEA